MVDVGTIAGVGGASASRTSVSASQKTSDATTTSFTAALASADQTSALTTTTSSGTVVNTIMPQVKTDPVAGLVTEYLDANGNVINQVPSTLALTYLRAGLTVDGRSRQHEVGMSGSTLYA